jgi:hypothetical protein
MYPFCGKIQGESPGVAGSCPNPAKPLEFEYPGRSVKSFPQV